MKFGEFALEDAEGGLLAHTHRLQTPSGKCVLKKGRRLGPEELEQLRAGGRTAVWVAFPDAGEVPEDEAAARLSAPMIGPFVRADPAATGRVNLFAETRGVFVTSAAHVDAVNHVDPQLTVATLPPHQVVEAGTMIATVKIIPFAVPSTALEAARAAAAPRAEAPLLAVHPFARLKTALVLTELPGVAASQLDRAERTQVARLQHVQAQLQRSLRVPHTHQALAEAVRTVLDDGVELVLMLGASAMVDVGDVLPATIETLGGTLQQVGMPVDPGNLLVLGEKDGVPIVGVPGCARSPKRSGFDNVLERLAARLPVDAHRIRSMGAGGLLSEIPSRPRPRAHEPRPRPARLAAVVLAAGRSTRMGAKNKLLERIDGVPMVRRVVDQLLETSLDPVFVVLGHEHERVSAALEGRAVKKVRNPDYREGLSTSLRAGISALDDEVDGVLVALGDMPFVSSEHIEKLIADVDPDKPETLRVPVRGGRPGNPVLFGARYFIELCERTGDRGARALIDQHSDVVEWVTMDDDAIYLDVDTPEALAALTGRRDVDSG